MLDWARLTPESMARNATMIGKLAGFWRFFQRLHTAGDVGGFDSRRFTVQQGIIASGMTGARFVGSVSAWDFIAKCSNSYPVHAAISSGLHLDLEVEVRAGKLDVAFLANDGKTVIDNAALEIGRSRVSLEASRAVDVEALVVRSRDGGLVDVEVCSLECDLRSVPSNKARGFLAKDAIADLRERLASTQAVIVDVGANRGDTIAAFLLRFPEARIWALEPHPKTFDAMASRFSGDGRVKPRKLALSGARGQAIMHSYSNAAINSLSPVAVAGERLIDGPVTAEAPVVVDHLSLGEFLKAESLESVDILKLDTQGHELEILQGHSELLRRGCVKFILAELLFSPLYSKQAQAGQVIYLLESCGFKVFDLYDFVYDTRSGLKWGDALFVFDESLRT